MAWCGAGCKTCRRQPVAAFCIKTQRAKSTPPKHGAKTHHNKQQQHQPPIQQDVAVVVDPSDYDELLQRLAEPADSPDALAFRKRLAWKAYQHTASYDSQVAEWLWGQVGGGAPPPELSVPMTLAQGLRYGENPHQSAAFYVDGSLAEAGAGGVATSVQHNGKEMSYNNYLDADAAYAACCDFKVRSLLDVWPLLLGARVQCL